MAHIETISPETPTSRALEILEPDGAVVFERVLDNHTMDAIQRELNPYLDRSFNGESEFWGMQTKRIAALVAKSRTFAERVAPNPVILSGHGSTIGTTLC